MVRKTNFSGLKSARLVLDTLKKQIIYDICEKSFFFIKGSDLQRYNVAFNPTAIQISSENCQTIVNPSNESLHGSKDQDQLQDRQRSDAQQQSGKCAIQFQSAWHDQTEYLNGSLCFSLSLYTRLL